MICCLLQRYLPYDTGRQQSGSCPAAQGHRGRWPHPGHKVKCECQGQSKERVWLYDGAVYQIIVNILFYIIGCKITFHCMWENFFKVHENPLSGKYFLPWKSLFMYMSQLVENFRINFHILNAELIFSVDNCFTIRNRWLQKKLSVFIL